MRFGESGAPHTVAVHNSSEHAARQGVQLPSESQSAVAQLTPHSTFSPEGVIAAPHVTSVAHALAVGVSRPPPMWWFAQRSFAPQLDEAGYAVVDGSARKRANSTAPFALRKPAPWLSASKPS